MPVDPAGSASLIQGGIGLVQSLGANARSKRLFGQRKAFQTPQEVFDILNMSQNNAQTGFSAETTDYLTSQADRGLSSSLGALTRLGGDPNAVGATLDNYFQDIFKIGNENELVKMKKFDSVLNALSLVAKNKEAEQISQDNLIKDQLQATAAQGQAGQQNLQSALNLGLNAYTAGKTQDLWTNFLQNNFGGISTPGSAVSASVLQPTYQQPNVLPPVGGPSARINI